MNPTIQSQLEVVLQILLGIGGAYFVHKGYITQDQDVSLVGGIVSLLIALIWAVYSRYAAMKVTITGAKRAGTSYHSLAEESKKPRAASAYTGRHVVPLLLIALLFASSGCVSSAEMTAQRENINSAVSPIKDEHTQWMHAIAGDPGYTLPRVSDMTPAERASWVNARTQWDTNYDKWYQDAKARDNDIFTSPTPAPTTVPSMMH